MKKVLLLSLGLVMGFGAFAQNRAVKQDLTPATVQLKKNAVGTEVVSGTFNPIAKGNQSVVTNRWESFEEVETIQTYYDLQSNGFVSNRMYQLNDGSVAVVATMSHEENQSAGDRGTGYNFCASGDMSTWGDLPEARVEGNVRTGWPTIAPYGANGEILVAHTTGLNYWIRETAGEGEWDGPYSIPDPTGLDGQQYAYNLSWARVATTGDNNDIIHVFAGSQTTNNEGTNTVAQFYCRSTDGENWEVNWSPLYNDNEHIDSYSADDYAISANGNTIAVVYVGSLTHHAVMYKSTDDGLTWERKVIWENPYYGFDWSTPESVYIDTMYGPAHASIAVGFDGVAHVALSTYAYKHGEVGDTYSIWSGLMSDGIAYWNDTQETIEAPNGNPHHALRCWWIEGGMIGELSCDTTRFCGWVPPHQELYWSEYDPSTYQYNENDYFYAMHGTSAYPSIAVDPQGNLALSYCSIDLNRDDMYNSAYYYRSAFVSYKAYDQNYWVVAADNLTSDFMHSMDEVTAVNAVSTPTRVNEWWFAAQHDEQPGFYWGNDASQTNATSNSIWVFKVSGEGINVEDAEAVDVVYNVYPNPASEMIFVSSSMDADATVTFTNLAGQTVKVVNANLTTGENGISINDLNSGIYFCTVKANGYSHTSKVVVK